MLKLQTIDTFTVPVTINAPGGPVEITVDFVQMSKDERQALVDSDEFKKEWKDVELLMKVMRGWGNVDLPFSREAVEKLCAYYLSASVDIMRKFLDETDWQKAKEKN